MKPLREQIPRLAVPGICVLLALMVWAVFGQTIGHEFVNYDDDLYVYENPEVSKGITPKGIAWAFTHEQVGMWAPLTTISHMLDCRIYGLRPRGHHLTNVLLHGAAAILLFLVLRQMTGAIWRSAFVAAVFAVHPLHVESVAWVSERKDVLSGVFFILTLAAYAHYTRKPRSLPRYLAALFLFATGLMCKSSLVTLPFVLLLLDYWPLGRFAPPGEAAADAPPDLPPWRDIARRLVLEKVPFFALSAAAGVIQMLVNQEGIIPVEKLSLVARISNALVSCVDYLAEMIYPARLAVFYPHPGNNPPVWEVLLAILLLGSISAGVFAWRRSRPYLLVGWLWYLGMLAPVIGVIQSGEQAHADRYTYLSQIGITFAIAWMAADLCAAMHWRHVVPWVPGAAGSMIIAALMWRAGIQASYWKNSETLWNHTLAVTTGNIIAHNNLGCALQQKGQVDQAIAQFQKSLKINPYRPDTHNFLGRALEQNGQVDDAIAQFQTSLEIDPNYAEARNNLGHALEQNGQTDKAIAQYEATLETNPGSAEANYHLGTVLLQKKRTEEAIAHFQKALEIDPADAAVHNDLGFVFQQQGRVDEAIAHYEQALAVNPDMLEARLNLGIALRQKGNLPQALAQFQKAIEIKPESAKAHNDLGTALQQEGQFDQAIIQYQKALEIDPKFVEARYNLGYAFQREARPREAIEEYEKALELKPGLAEALNSLAYVLAACPEASLRNGARAVELATKANQAAGGGDPRKLGTLAAAYAEAGRFSDAVDTAQRALDLANSQSNTAFAEMLRSQIALYKDGKPWRDQNLKK